MRRTTVSRRPPPPPLTTSRRPGERSRPRDVSPAAYGIPALVAAGVFLVAYDNGTYDDVARLSLAVGVWWFVLLAVAVGLLPLARPPRAAVLAGFFLAGLAALAFASVGWSSSAERAFTEFDRTALFFGIFVLVVMLGKPGTSGRFADGIALGITAIGLLALAARCFPNVISETDYSTVLPSAYTRLSYPLGYWNGLGIFTGISFPLLLRAALVSRRLLLRGLALVPLPALAAVIYLTSSRGGFATATFGTLAFVVLAARRWTALAAAATAALGAAGAIALLQTRDTLVNGPLDSSLAVSQGRSAALLILALGVLAGLVWTVGSALLDDRLPASVVLDRAAAAVVVLAAVIGIAAAHPVQRFRDFKQPPRQLTSKTHDLVKAHLLSTNGSGRYQLWRVAGREFKAEPLHGGGAGSFEAYWAQHATINGFVRDAHSLYIELLGELGIWGLLLVVGAFGTAIVTGLRRLLASADDERITIAAVLAAFGAYALGAGVDWMWELTAVSVVGIGLLGLLVGPATVPAPERRIAARYASALARPGRGVAARTAVGVIALFLVLAEGVPLLGQLRIRDSQAEIARGDLAAALSDAQSAKTIEPWAASPYVQVALVEEQAGQLRPARHRIGQAIHRDSTDWRLWVIQARLETKLGDIPAAQKSIERARELNPRSPLLAKSA